MKNQVLAFLISMFSVFCAFANSENSLFEKVNLPQGTQVVETILQSIEKQSTLRFAYDNQLSAIQTKIHLPKSEWQVKEILDYTFHRTNIQYISKGNHIVLVEKTVAPRFSKYVLFLS